MNCRCCGANADEAQRCGYCGLPVRDHEEIDGLKYALMLLERIEDIRVQSFSYTIDRAGRRLVDEGARGEPIVRRGLDCFETPIWGDKLYVQVPGTQKRLSISYRMQKELRMSNFSICLPKTLDFWRFGIMIQRSLKFRAFLGNPDNCTESGDIPIEFMNL
ncbi:MAG: hypothetical protein LBU32_17810 [Clostridiales bacterium]|jgi:hypothetical protein|nr:hypothetical protein [Clostridiales bacterium]